MSRRGAALLVAGFALVRGLLVAAIIPPFHGVDEQAHFDYAQRLAEARSLPELETNCAQLSPEAREAVRLIVEDVHFHPERRVPDLRHLALPEGRFTRGCGPAASYPPLYYAFTALYYSAAAQAPLFGRLFAARLASVLLGALAGVFSLFAMLRFFGERKAALCAAAVVVLQPQLAFLFGVVNNDAGLFACSAAALWAIAALPGHRRALFGLGFAAALGALCKPTMLVHLPALGLLAACALGPRSAKSWLLAALALFPAAALGAGFALWRGTPLAPAAAAHPLSLTAYLAHALAPKHVFFLWHETYWMGWGWLDTWLPKAWYLLLALLLLAAAAAAVLGWRRLHDRERGLLVAGAAATALSLIALHAIEFISMRGSGEGLLQGRYLLPLFPLHAAMLVTALRAARARIDWSWALPAFLSLMLCASYLRALRRFYG